VDAVACRVNQQQAGLSERAFAGDLVEDGVDGLGFVPADGGDEQEEDVSRGGEVEHGVAMSAGESSDGYAQPGALWSGQQALAARGAGLGDHHAGGLVLADGDAGDYESGEVVLARFDLADGDARREGQGVASDCANLPGVGDLHGDAEGGAGVGDAVGDGVIHRIYPPRSERWWFCAW
jgi:hypothetical protein